MGTVVAACIARPGELWKTPVADGVVVEEHGFRGDRHAGPTRPSHGEPGVPKPNDRQVSVVAQEVLGGVGKQLGITLAPGNLGENLTVAGLGDLSDVGPGWRLRTERGVVFRVTEQNDPCDNLLEYHRHMLKAVYGRRGVVAVVEAGAGQVVRAGDRIELEHP